MTSRVNGAAATSEPSVRSTPAGFDWSVSATVRGSSRRVTVRVRPFASRAVSWSSR